jgi:kumamolisin
VDWQSGDSWLEISGPAASVERSLGIVIRVEHGVGGRAGWSAEGTPKIPAATCGEITGFGVLHSFVHVSLGATVASGSGLTADQVDAYRPSDLRAFASANGAPFKLLAPFGNSGPVEGESNLDLETVHEIVPAATLVDVNLNASRFSNMSTAATFASAFDLARRDWPGSVWSLSIGVCEHDRSAFNPTDLAVLNSAVEQAEATGTTVFASSGDDGGLDCTPPNGAGSVPKNSWQGVSVPASLPSVTGVGGTTLLTSSDGTWRQETAWVDPLLSQGSGGGLSDVFSRPSWQNAPGTAAAAAAGTAASDQSLDAREVPDVSADADPATGNAIVVGGRSAQGGGTSLATPIWAGLTVLIDQYLATTHHHELGFLNPSLYALARTVQPYPPFHDVTIGGNDFYAATPGYDLVTGLGSPDIFNLARDLSRAT